MANNTRIVRREELPNPKLLRGRVNLSGTFPTDAYIVGVPKVVSKDFSLTQSAAGAPGALTSLFSFTIPAGTLRVGDDVELVVGGFFNTNDNNKNLQFEAGGNVIESTGLIDIDDLGWQLFYNFGVFSTTVLRHALSLVAGLVQADSTPTLAGGFGGRCISRGGSNGVANIDSNNLVLEMKGQGTALGDVTKSFARIKVTRN